MESSVLKKRKERIKEKLFPLTLCEIFFREGDVLNNSKILAESVRDFTIGRDFKFNYVEEHDLVNIVFKSRVDNITNTWTVYKKGEYARVVKTN